ncbi:MAG: prepilin peptidase [Butyrivibrio sp.]|nr:prepilin peptidase [Muribaculum sp.]MCM1552427.1 prepilin peptidase [Butyrivibrio sp.]
MLPEILLYIIVFLYGIVIGSFLNVLIFRVPKKENIAMTRSHCMSCGYQLKWYDLVPLFSYLALGGRCRKCKTRISVQYPLIEGLNGILYLLVYYRYGLSIESLLYCLLFSALLALSVIDFRTYEIPIGFNYFILTLGLVRMVTDFSNWLEYAIGLIAVSLVLYVIYRVSGGAAIGGGDVRLMGATGLLLGWKLNILAFLLGCILGSVIHVIRMRVTKADHVLAMGPYLSMGLMIAVLWGNEFLAWYLGVLGV